MPLLLMALLMLCCCRDTSELVLYSTAPGAKVLQRVASSNISNLGSVVFHPQSWEPQAVSFNYLRPRCERVVCVWGGAGSGGVERRENRLCGKRGKAEETG
jgi:hypothetical protein